VISVVVLQNSMDLVKGELGSSNKTCVTSALDGNTMSSIEAEMVSHVREEEDRGPPTIPAIKTEPFESFEFVVSVTQISCSLYPELPALISLCPCETKILLLGMDLEQFYKKGNLYFVTHCM
jgi:hypothetical protein